MGPGPFAVERRPAPSVRARPSHGRSRLPRAARRPWSRPTAPRPARAGAAAAEPRRLALWLATAGTGWLVRRSTDLLPQLLCLAGAEVRHWAHGTSGPAGPTGRPGAAERARHRHVQDAARRAARPGVRAARHYGGVTGRWEFWIDRGGTFTDVVGRDRTAAWSPASCSRTTRSATGTPPWPGSACCWASARRDPVPADRVAAVKMGTTVATNALLERKRRADRPRRHRGLPRRPAHRLPEPAPPLRPPDRPARGRCTSGSIEVPERIDAHGADRPPARPGRRRPRRCAPPATTASAAPPSSCMHGYRHPAHETRRRRARPASSASPRSAAPTRSAR